MTPGVFGGGCGPSPRAAAAADAAEAAFSARRFARRSSFGRPAPSKKRSVPVAETLRPQSAT